MTERPIIFNDEMVRAIIDGRKTQTRRPAQFRSPDGANLAFSGLTAGHYHTGAPQHGWTLYSRGAGGCWNDRAERLRCPFGAPGDLLWVREAFTSGTMNGGALQWVRYRATDARDVPDGTRWRPSIHMPRHFSRLALRVTDVRVERVQDITEEDARAEGIYEPNRYQECCGCPDVDEIAGPICCNRPDTVEDWQGAFADLWDSIYAPRGLGWNASPWAWVVGFEMVEADRG